MTKRNLQAIGLLLIIGLFASCKQESKQPDEQSVTVSILPQKYFVQALMGNRFEVNVMVTPGASPANYEPTPRQMAALSKSGLYLTIGHLGFEEAWVPRFQKTYPSLKIVNSSSGIKLLGEEEEEEEDHGHSHKHGIDPHVWMSPKQARQIVINTAGALTKFDEACKDLIAHNRDSLLNVLDDLDQRYTEALAPIQNRKFIIFHPALSYLARDYHFEQIAMEFEGKEPSPAYFKSIVDRAKSEEIKLLFIQKEFDIENARQMAREIGAELIQIDPLAEDWYSQMLDILKKLQKLK
ncbi:MAG: zinc ABC transporter substrate-binding protein [Bacteroidales bacterium]|nr:zinc ABC transporter substrate-binding protein [Bacteroidales bacterium]